MFRDRLRFLVNAIDSFCFEVPFKTKSAPFIRDSIDIKRWMIIVFLALMPCTFVAIWNSGVTGYVYSSENLELYNSYVFASQGLGSYFSFCQQHFVSILTTGLWAFMPIVIVSYAVGGFWEVFFALWRKHEISEGLLVSGILFALILPASIPLWMVAVGISFGIIVGKELFGGTGMNILNPALTCRAFLYFAYPNKMSGDIWAGSNQSLLKMNQSGGLTGVDAISNASILPTLETSEGIKRAHTEAISSLWQKIDSSYLTDRLAQFSKYVGESLKFGELSVTDLQRFVTSPLDVGGLNLSPDAFVQAYQSVEAKLGLGLFSNWNLFLGNQIGSLGETSTLACLLGAILLLITGIGSWRTMFGFSLGVLISGLMFQWGSHLGPNEGLWNSAIYDFPFYKQFLTGGLAFGLVFMATDPVSSPSMASAKWAYGILIGFVTVVIRLVNPAFDEGVMLAILFGNVLAPLLDQIALFIFNRERRRYA